MVDRSVVNEIHESARLVESALRAINDWMMSRGHTAHRDLSEHLRVSMLGLYAAIDGLGNPDVPPAEAEQAGAQATTDTVMTPPVPDGVVPPEDFNTLLARVRTLPDMTAEERISQAISFVHGNLSASTHHRPVSRESVAAEVWRREWEKIASLAREMAQTLGAWDVASADRYRAAQAELFKLVGAKT